MMTCPQCNTTYTDDYLFCLADGSPLCDESGETPTVVGKTFSPHIAPTEVMSTCVECGYANRANSHFCEKCGKRLINTPPENIFSPVPPHFVQRQQFTPVVAAPQSQSGPQYPRPQHSSNQTMLIVAGALAVLVIVVGVIAYNAGIEKATSNTGSANAKKRAIAANTAVNAANIASNAAANAGRSKDSRIGKTGELTTDCNLREYPNRDALKLGTHYRGARIRILDTAEVANEDGGTSTWFRIEVLSYGVSLDPANYGLTKDPGTPDEGWVNSYPKVWDNDINGYKRIQLVEFD